MKKTTRFSAKSVIATFASIVASFLVGTQYRPTSLEDRKIQTVEGVQSVEFDSVTTASTYEQARTGRVVSFYTTNENGVHTKLFRQESPSQGTFVSVPGRVNGVDVRMVVVIDPIE